MTWSDWSCGNLMKIKVKFHGLDEKSRVVADEAKRDGQTFSEPSKSLEPLIIWFTSPVEKNREREGGEKLFGFHFLYQIYVWVKYISNFISQNLFCSSEFAVLMTGEITPLFALVSSRFSNLEHPHFTSPLSGQSKREIAREVPPASSNILIKI